MVSLVSRSGPRMSRRVAEILSERICSGMYCVGNPLPTERVLAADLGVHRRSVRTAINQLVLDGLVSRRPNCRPTVGAQVPQAVLGEPVQDFSRTPISASNLIALIMWHGGGPLESGATAQQRIFWGMNRLLMRLGYHAVFLDLGGDQIGTEEQNAAREAAHLRYIRDQGFGGALFYPYSYRQNGELVREVNRTVPIVLLDRRIEGVEMDFVGIENRKAMFDAVEHLKSLGHRRIAHFTRFEAIQSVQDRIWGYLDAMHGAGADELLEMIVNVPAYRDERYWAMIDLVLRVPKEQRPTAAVCVNDYMALAIAQRLEYLGLSIPNDVAVTGFDNIVATLADGPGLTTVAQPYEEIGSMAVELLMQRIKDPSAPAKSIHLPARLVVRGSTDVRA